MKITRKEKSELIKELVAVYIEAMDEASQTLLEAINDSIQSYLTEGEDEMDTIDEVYSWVIEKYEGKR